MGLFDKKYCDVCGKQIGLLGNRKLKDGNLCKDCASKLSPWFSGRKASTVSEIKEQLNYRAANESKVKLFVPHKQFEGLYKVYVDEIKKQFIVTRSSNWKTNNPDVINNTDVLTVECVVNEDKDELMTKDADGKECSYEPAKFEYSYEFKMTIRVNNPYFDELEFELTDDHPTSPDSEEYKKYVDMANGISEALIGRPCTITEKNTYVAESAETETETVTLLEGEWLCPECGTKNNENFCSNCGTKKPSAQGVIKFCPQCGYKIPEGTTIKFCPQCGKQLG